MKSLEELKGEFELFKEDIELGTIDKDTYQRILGDLKQRERSGDKKATHLLKQLISAWEREDKYAFKSAKSDLKNKPDIVNKK